MKNTLICLVGSLALGLSSVAIADIPNPADRPDLGKAVAKCYKNGKLKKNRVVWNGRCYLKPQCEDGYVYGPSVGGCMQNNGGGE